MAKKKQKFYVVWKGLATGIFRDWESCRAQVVGYTGAKYKSFDSLEEAESAFRNGPSKSVPPKASLLNRNEYKSAKIIRNSLSVDAASSGNPGIMEYRGVWTHSGEEVFRMGPFKEGTNNIGEFLALVHGIALLKKMGHKEMAIYSDSKTAMSWLRNKKIKTTLQRSARNEELFQLMERAMKWLEQNSFNNPVLKWQTEKWGEIPADFGRK